MATREIAPAKVNLFLHVIDKRSDGYHLLESLISFSNYGDVLTVEKADKFGLNIIGPFSNMIQADQDNLITRATQIYLGDNKPLPPLQVTLEKNIPIGAGLGGGSSDAAAMIKILQKLKIPMREDQTIDEILLSLGADVPVCYHGKSCFMEGIGEKITPLSLSEKIPAILIHPNISCATPTIFSQIMSPYTPSIDQELLHYDALSFLHKQQNDLSAAAIKIVPDIQNILENLNEQSGCFLARMSGSGSACFGLFDTKDLAEQAALKIKEQHPQWWVQPITLN